MSPSEPLLRARRGAFVALLVALLALLAGCRGDAGIPIVRWTLDGRTAVNLPADLTPYLHRRGGTYRLATRVALPPELRGQDLSLALVQMWGAPRLAVAGVAIDDQARTSFQRDRSRSTHLYRIPAELTRAATLDLELAVEDTYDFCAIFRLPPVLARGRDGPSAYRWVKLFNDTTPVVAVTLGLLGVVAFLLFSVGSSRREIYRWAAVAGFATQGSPLNHLGVWQYALGYRGDVVSPLVLILGGYAFLRFARAYIDQPRPGRGWTALALVSAAAGVLAFRRFDTRWMFVLTFGATALFTIAAGVTLLRARRAVRNARLLAALLLAGAVMTVPAIGMIALRSTLPGHDIRQGMLLDELAPSALIFVMLVAFVRDYRAATFDLATQLAAVRTREREVTDLNDELRRQIAERSRDLADALAGSLRAEGESPEFPAGGVIEGRYAVVQTLGRGGMGIVYEVTRLADGRRFALKSLAGQRDAGTTARLAREAELVASLHHPNLVGVVDVGFARSGFLYLVMELVAGGSLEAARGRFGDAAWALPLLRDVAAGIAALHACGVVHRDLKPSNILLVEGDAAPARAKIADFGISRRDEVSNVDPDGATLQARRLTVTGALVGTPLYMAPELAGGDRTARPPSDVFSFGVLAYEALTGRYPFVAPPVFAQHASAQSAADSPLRARPTREVNPQVPVALADVVDACLSFDPAARPSAQSLLAAFAGIDPTTPGDRDSRTKSQS